MDIGIAVVCKPGELKLLTAVTLSILSLSKDEGLMIISTKDDKGFGKLSLTVFIFDFLIWIILSAYQNSALSKLVSSSLTIL